MRYGFVKIIFSLIILVSINEAKILNVPTEYVTIQSAINSAEEGDTVLVDNGTYYENIRFSGKNIVVASNFIIDGNLNHIKNTIIDGSQPSNSDTASCALIISGEDSTTVLQGFTLTGGIGTKWRDEHGAGTYREGGGILITFSSPTIKNNLILNNEAIDRTGCVSAGGGGIRIGDGNPYILNNVIMYNKGRYGAGIVLNYSEGVIKNNVIAYNSGGEDYGGGGIWTLNEGTTIIENNTIVNNSVTGSGGARGKGGGILVWGTSIIAINNIVYNNSQSSGGQVYLYSGGTANISYSNIEGGYTGEGNINIDPLFDNINFYLNENSNCIDSGNPSEEFNDVEDPANPGNPLFPSLGTLRNDMGAYGGPGMINFPQFFTVDVIDETDNLPKRFYLFQNYPNPFNPVTNINFYIAESGLVQLKIYDILGNEITTLINEERNPGKYEVRFDGSGLSSGIYFYKLILSSESANFSETKKFVLMR